MQEVKFLTVHGDTDLTDEVGWTESPKGSRAQIRIRLRGTFQ